jgi:folate-binding protein YgfZ
VTFANGAYWFDIEAGFVAEFVKRMKLYRLRAKVEIHDDGPMHGVYWSPDSASPPEGTFPADAMVIAYRDERDPRLGMRYIVDRIAERGEMRASVDPTETVEAARVPTGIPEFPDFKANEVFPHDIGMDLLHGVDFVKGCYVGQEVVSRMQHRGTARRRPVMVSGLPGKIALDTPLMVGEREVGTIETNYNGAGIAIVRLDRIPDGDAATVGGIPVRLTIPSWGTYRFGESGSAE